MRQRWSSWRRRVIDGTSAAERMAGQQRQLEWEGRKNPNRRREMRKLTALTALVTGLMFTMAPSAQADGCYSDSLMAYVDSRIPSGNQTESADGKKSRPRCWSRTVG